MSVNAIVTDGFLFSTSLIITGGFEPASVPPPAPNGGWPVIHDDDAGPMHRVEVPGGAQYQYGPVSSGVTYGTIIDDVLDRLAESRTAPVFWSRDELMVYLNDGFLEFTLMAGQLISENVYPLVGAKIQAVPSTAIALIHVSYVSVLAEKSTLEQFDRADPGWEAKYGIFQRWAPCGLDKWFLDKHPVTAIYANLTTLDVPPELTEADFIDLAPEYVEALTDYVFHMARFKEGGAEFGQAMTQYDSFRNKAGLQEQRTYVDQFVLWARDPNAKTGEDYAS